MTIPDKQIYPRTGDQQTIYLKNVITNPNIIVGDYTIYNDLSMIQLCLSRIMYYITIQSTKTN